MRGGRTRTAARGVSKLFQMGEARIAQTCAIDVPTRTEVLLDSSSEALEVPPFFGFEDMDRRLEERGFLCIIMLIGRGTPPPVGGDAGGDAMAMCGNGKAVRSLVSVRSRVAGRVAWQIDGVELLLLQVRWRDRQVGPAVVGGPHVVLRVTGAQPERRVQTRECRG